MKSSYPKWKYHASEGCKKVNNEEEEKALGYGWSDNSEIVRDKSLIVRAQAPVIPAKKTEKKKPSKSPAKKNEGK